MALFLDIDLSESIPDHVMPFITGFKSVVPALELLALAAILLVALELLSRVTAFLFKARDEDPHSATVTDTNLSVEILSPSEFISPTSDRAKPRPRIALRRKNRIPGMLPPARIERGQSPARNL